MEKRNLTRFSLFIFALFFLANQGFSQSFTNNTPFAVADNTTASSTVDVSGLTGDVTDITLDVALNATWVGDVTITLTAPDGVNSITVLNSPGVLNGAGAGDSSDALSSSPVSFSDAAVDSAEDMGITILGTEVVCQDDGICEYSPFPDEAAGPTTFADFIAAVGASAANHNGTWTLEVSDGAGGDPTSVDSYTLNFTSAGGGAGGAAVPTMSEWGLFMFFLVTLNLGLVFMYKMEAQKDMALAGGSASSSMSNNLPFEMNAFKAAMKHALGLAVVGFAIILVGWGEITSIDLVGMMMSIPMVAYIIQTANLLKK